mmetsp:Transcript_4496/g.11188  ORF Transcript_4496/g.11188 Transcript_4496/m.11188 type:complete len:251 (+) Transcript_4496:22-774(+)
MDEGQLRRPGQLHADEPKAQRVDVEVPAGCQPGDTFVVEAEGQQFEVEVPFGCNGGEIISVELPPHSGAETAIGSPGPTPSGSSTLVFEVYVPEGFVEGTPLLVSAAGREFEVDVPEGCGPGSLITVELPDDESPSDETELASVDTHHDCDVSSASETQKAERSSSMAAEEDVFYDSEESTEFNKFAIGQPVEVLRTDGTWSLGTPLDYESLGGTYTVQLTDGRCKYMVEEDALRIPRFMLQSISIALRA